MYFDVCCATYLPASQSGSLKAAIEQICLSSRPFVNIHKNRRELASRQSCSHHALKICFALYIGTLYQQTLDTPARRIYTSTVGIDSYTNQKVRKYASTK